MVAPVTASLPLRPTTLIKLPLSESLVIALLVVLAVKVVAALKPVEPLYVPYSATPKAAGLMVALIVLLKT